MADPFLSEVRLYAFGFAPKGWAFCQGQLLPIQQNQALFALVGTTYGGNGVTTFALPNLRGRVPIGLGPFPGGATGQYLGETGGADAVALTLTQMPQHGHAIDPGAITAMARVRNGAGDQRSPVGSVPAADASGVATLYSDAAPDANMNAAAVYVGGGLTATSAGGGQGHENRQPYAVLNYCIALQGIFPTRP
jgi:microcystin-dependent protein